MIASKISCRISVRSLLLLFLFVSFPLAFVSRQLYLAREERKAFNELCQLGATGDDFVGIGEIFLGQEYAPIVQLSLPPDLSIDANMHLLSRLRHLESLNLSGHQLDEVSIRLVSEIKWLTALDLSNAKLPRDGLGHLSQLQSLRWLYLKGTEISKADLANLRRDLPSCRFVLQ
jgi:Leucine-rich repeat (LRR) protein